MALAHDRFPHECAVSVSLTPANYTRLSLLTKNPTTGAGATPPVNSVPRNCRDEPGGPRAGNGLAHEVRTHIIPSWCYINMRRFY